MSGLGEHSVVLAWAIDISTMLVLTALVLAFVRMVRGPTLVDRVVSADLFAVLAVGVVGLASVAVDRSLILDVAVATALVAFLATVAFAWFANRRADQLESLNVDQGQQEKR